ncbi:MAG: 4-alpha-glucanotransferase, partial [Lysobacterales bacterium]
MHIGVWQFLPTGPTAYGDSPYQPLSAFAGNENLIGVEPLVRAGLISEIETETLKGLPVDFVDYPKLIPAKSALLARAVERFSNKVNGKLKSSYEEFLHLHDEHWLDDYALYRILKKRHGERPWPEWDQPYSHRDPDAISRIRGSSADAMERIKFIQFLFDRQWRKLRKRARENDVCLFADMPIYIALDSADAWAHPEILRIDRDGRLAHVSGVPPDYFSEDGQLWGNPLYDWDHHVANGFTWWTERLRNSISLTDLVRFDHFRGFAAFWSVPAKSKTAREGRWEAGPGDAIFEAMRNTLGDLPIVAEDLGVITPAVESLRDRYQIPGMKVLQFAVTEADFDVAD